jgi:hypothetical protein
MVQEDAIYLVQDVEQQVDILADPCGGITRDVYLAQGCYAAAQAPPACWESPCWQHRWLENGPRAYCR